MTSASVSDLCLGAVIDGADHGIIVLDPAQRVVRWNAWVALHSGVGAEAALGRSLDELFQGVLSIRLTSAIADCLSHGHAHILSPSLNRRPFPLSTVGEDVTERASIEQTVTVKPIGAHGQQRWCLIQITDVSLSARRERFLRRQTNELSRIVDELRITRDAATRANVAKSEFLTDMSHELRSPLNAIIGFSQLLQMPQTGPVSDEQMEFITYIRRAGEHLIKMITDILDLSRIEANKLVIETDTIEVDRFIIDSIRGVKGLSHGRNISVVYAHDGADPLRVSADRTRMAQIVINLLSNAIKYNRPGGSVTVAVATTGLGRVRISVSDTGPGIPVERQPELFKSFNRLGAEFGEIEGAGIGLALSRRLAELMGGAMGFDSRLGAGSTFWVEMPMAQTGAASVVVVEGEGGPDVPVLRPFSLLYVEDNPVDLRLVSALFKTLPEARLISARTGAEGLRLAEEQRPDVVLLDINLPDHNGFEVLRRIQGLEKGNAIPVLAISASALSDDIARGLAAGFHHWLTKPLDVTQFLRLLAEILKITAVRSEIR